MQSFVFMYVIPFFTISLPEASVRCVIAKTRPGLHAALLESGSQLSRVCLFLVSISDQSPTSVDSDILSVDP